MKYDIFHVKKFLYKCANTLGVDFYFHPHLKNNVQMNIIFRLCIFDDVILFYVVFLVWYKQSENLGLFPWIEVYYFWGEFTTLKLIKGFMIKTF